MKDFILFTGFALCLFLWVEAYNHGCFTTKYPFFKWQPIFDSVYLHWKEAETGALKRWQKRET